MSRQNCSLFLSLGLALAGSAFAQNAAPPQQNGNNAGGRQDTGGRDRGGRDRGPGFGGFGGDRSWLDRSLFFPPPPQNGDRGRGGFGSRRGGPGGWNPTPEQREDMYNGMVSRYMEVLGKSYELTPEQQSAFQQQLTKLRDQSSDTADERAKQREKLWGQMRELREKREAGEQVDDSQFQQLGEQMRSTMSPLMNSEQVIQDLEKGLPEGQIARGRASVQKMRDDRAKEWEQRRQEWDQRRQEWEQRRQQGNDQNNPGDGQNGDRRDRGRDSRRDDWRQRSEERRDRGSSNEPLSVDAWERYTRDFIRRYQLDNSQQATANSALRDALAQRRVYEEANRANVAAAQQIADPEQKRKQIDSLNAPINQMFERLKTKLYDVPNAAQKAAVGADPATQPASTQPSSDRRDRWRNRGEDRNNDRGNDRNRGQDNNGRDRGGDNNRSRTGSPGGRATNDGKNPDKLNGGQTAGKSGAKLKGKNPYKYPFGDAGLDPVVAIG